MRRLLPAALTALGLLGAAAVLMLGRGSAPALALTNCDVAHGALDASELEMLALINAERAKVGALPLLPSNTLSNAAAWMSQDVVDNDYFSHTDSLGRTFDVRFHQCGHSGGYIGENLAMGSSDPATIFNGWMNSPGHKASMLSTNFAFAGIGFYEFVWTLDLASVNSDGSTPPTVPGLTGTATGTPTATPTSTSTPTATPARTFTAEPGRAILPLVSFE